MRLSARLAVERLLPVLALVSATASVPLMVFSPEGLERLNRLREERRRIDSDIARLTREIRRLREEVQRIKSDPAAVERAARDELGLVRKTEVVFQFAERR
jgi:cell division protein FtsB